MLHATNNDAFSYISFSLSAVGLDHYYSDIQNSLRKNYVGWVLFDQLLSHGIKKQRFASMYFDGESFDPNSFKIEEDITQEIKQICANFYVNSPKDVLSHGVLTRSQQFLVSKGKLL